MNLCAVRLSQKVMVPSVPRVRTQQCAVPLALVPTHTYASRPKPSRRLHSRVAWSSQSPCEGQIVGLWKSHHQHHDFNDESKLATELFVLMKDLVTSLKQSQKPIRAFELRHFFIVGILTKVKK